jgi:hypothetical protein
MSSVMTPNTAARVFQHDELQAELRHIRDLVVLRDLFRARGASSAELRRYDAVVDEARTRLARSAKQSAAHYASAA